MKTSNGIKFHVVTLFPEVIEAYTQASILGRAQKEKKLSVKAYQLRDYALKPRSKSGWWYRKVDDKAYGGGPGMVLQAEPAIRAAEKIKKDRLRHERPPRSLMSDLRGRSLRVIITSAGGKPLTNAYAKKLAKEKDVIIICGRYEGLDARAKKILKAEEVSVGPYILTGGEVPALAIIDATARQIKGVLGKFESLEEGRVASHDVYTRPEVIIHKGKKYRVPRVLLTGHHKNINAWKQKKPHSAKRTQ